MRSILRRSWELWLGFGLVVALYGAFASQGALPLLSPDETAVWSVAQGVWEHGSPILREARAEAFPWLHPRSFVAQYGVLFPVGFPTWPVILSVFSRLPGVLMHWVAVLVSASLLFPLVWGMERFGGWSRRRSVAWALTGMLVPVAVLYGNRSFFTLMPQLAGVGWVGYWLMRGEAYPVRRLVGVGVVAALVLGLRPLEALWILPWWVLALFWRGAHKSVSRHQVRALMLGGVLGGGLVAGIHAWTYGAPWMIGYWLRALPVLDVPAVGVSPEDGSSVWRAVFPYGYAPRQLWTNARAAWSLGVWPWALLIALGGVALARRGREAFSQVQGGVILAFVWTACVLAVFYGQGRFSDHIGGLSMHLGNSFLRYTAPLWIGLTLWAWYQLGAWYDVSKQGWTVWSRRSIATGFGGLFLAFIGGGVAWAYTDAEDGILRGRREREHYAFVRSFVVDETDMSTIWLSERSDKMLVPARAATAGIPPLAEVRRFLEANQGRVWMYRRPLSQQDRDAWRKAGLDVIEHGRFPREIIYEVRLR